MALIVRNILFFAAIMAAIIVFVIIFGWFPVYNAAAWIGFFISFAVCTAIRAVIMHFEEQAENKKMQEALRRFNKQ